MKSVTISLVSGMIFGYGLSLSKMADREIVLGFLDVSGKWDATLLLVFVAALGTTLICWRFILKLPRPLCEKGFALPPKRNIDTKLILGSVIFGIGWGLGGYCPGPGIVAITLGSWVGPLFVISMVVGICLHQAMENYGH